MLITQILMGVLSMEFSSNEPSLEPFYHDFCAILIGDVQHNMVRTSEQLNQQELLSTSRHRKIEVKIVSLDIFQDQDILFR